MNTRILKPTVENIKKAVQVLKQGGLVIYPTETLYGIAVDPLNEGAVEKVNQLKGRTAVGYIVICSDLRQAERYCYLTEEEKRFTKSKRPTTIIAKKNKTWPDFTNKEFAFRISPNPVAKALAKEFGKPILSTSVNLAGHKPANSAKEAQETFSGKVDLILDSGKLPKRKASRIIKDGKIIRN